MIRLVDICKRYRIGSRHRIILDHLNADFVPGVNMGILGRNGTGKSTLVKIIGGSILPDSGHVERTSRISWPIGFSGCFNSKLSGRANLRFVCRIYGADIHEVTEFVEDFSELGQYMDMPIKSYSSGMAAKLAFGLSMAIGFDYYLIDEVSAVGDASFRKKCNTVFNQRKEKATLIVVSHNIATIKKHCDSAAVLNNGNLVFYEKVDNAVERYEEICSKPLEMRFV
ncbi:MAG: ABC transporter ATP-binding protein [Desulfovibrionaceae bacterium]|nr:ABC transporter ATP-binding protein [Desulfovibrionaceae bacterium]